jgi:hypothetical protein
MHRIFVLCVVAVALAAPAAATAATSFQVVGVEVSASPATFVGAAKLNGETVGAWYAVVPHTPLSNDPNNPAQICTAAEPPPCGAFALSAGSQVFTGAFLGGTVTFAGLVATGDGCPDQTYAIDGTLTDGTFQALLRHYRKFPALGCPIVGATVTGNASLT